MKMKKYFLITGVSITSLLFTFTNVALASYDLPDTSRYAYFSDPSLRQSVESQLGRGWDIDEPILKEDIEKGNLEIFGFQSSYNLANLSGIQNIPQIKNLFIEGDNNIIDYRPVSTLTNLESLIGGSSDSTIVENPTTPYTLDYLKPLKKLKSLQIPGSVLDLTPLNELDNLEQITILSHPSSYKTELMISPTIVSKQTHSTKLVNPVKLSKQFGDSKLETMVDVGTLIEQDNGKIFEITDIPENIEYIEVSSRAVNNTARYSIVYKIPVYWN